MNISETLVGGDYIVIIQDFNKQSSMDPVSPTQEGNGNCSLFSSQIFYIVAVTSSVANFFSLLANIFVLLLIFLYKRWSFFHQRLILYLSISTVVAGLAGIFTRVDNQDEGGAVYDRFCVFAGFMLQVASWMVLDAYIAISASLLLKAFFSINLETFKSDVVVVLFVFVFPFVFNWIPFINSAYGDTGAWCWIASIRESNCEVLLFGRVLQIVLWYFPLYAILCVLIIVYSMVLIRFCLYRRNGLSMDPKIASQRQQAIRFSASLLTYPIIYFVASILPLVNRIHGFIYPNQPSIPLWFLSGIIYPLQGLGIALAFLLDSGFRKRLNPTGVKAAFTEWFKKQRVVEYPMAEGDRERTMEYHRYTN